MSAAAAVKIGRELKAITEDPVEGVYCSIRDDSNVFEWRVWFEGSKGSPYEGGIYQMSLNFPTEYPMLPPKLKMVSNFWHPNVYPNGDVCISILHPPVDDPMSGERPEERWLPTQTVSTIMLSFLSMLHDPNPSSPANVDASVEWRDRRSEYEARCKKLAEQSRLEVSEEIISLIPHPDTDPDERARRIDKMKILNAPMTTLDDDDYDYGFGSDDDVDYYGSDMSFGSDMEAEATEDRADDD